MGEPSDQSSRRPPGSPAPPAGPRRPWPPSCRSPTRVPPTRTCQERSETPEEKNMNKPAQNKYIEINEPEPASLQPEADLQELPPPPPLSSPARDLGASQLASQKRIQEEKSEKTKINKNVRSGSPSTSPSPSERPPCCPPPGRASSGRGSSSPRCLRQV